MASEKVGNLRYYRVNKASPLYTEMKGIIAKTTGIQASLREGLRRAKGIQTVLMYGLERHENEEVLGPIRLMVIGEVDLNELNEAIRALESRLNREINYLVFDEAEYQRRKAEDDPFLVEVLKGRRAILIGTGDGL